METIRRDQGTLEMWAPPVTRALDEFAKRMNWGACDVQRRIQAPIGLSGAYVTLTGRRSSVRIALLAGASGLQSLAHALLVAFPEHKFAVDDITDALCELANILAGCVKRELGPAGDEFVTGLPVFYFGNVKQHLRGNWLSFEAILAETKASVVVIEEWPVRS